MPVASDDDDDEGITTIVPLLNQPAAAVTTVTVEPFGDSVTSYSHQPLGTSLRRCFSGPMYDDRLGDSNNAGHALLSDAASLHVSRAASRMDLTSGGSGSEASSPKGNGGTPTHRLGLVCDGVYIGSFRAVNSVSAARQFGLTSFLCVADCVPRPSYVTDDDLSRGAVAFLWLPLLDSPRTRLAEHFDAAFAFLDEQRRLRRNTAIYCHRGQSRSAAMAVAYILRCSNGKLRSMDALHALQRRYSDANPNISFCLQLQEHFDDGTTTPNSPSKLDAKGAQRFATIPTELYTTSTRAGPRPSYLAVTPLVPDNTDVQC
jgi:hypothetical protein